MLNEIIKSVIIRKKNKTAPLKLNCKQNFIGETDSEVVNMNEATVEGSLQ